MKLSIWSSYYVELSPENAILELAKNGIHYTELSDEHGEMLLKRGNPIEVGKAFGEFARANGVEISQGHLWLRVALCSKEENSVEILKDWLDLYDAIGIKAAVLHCDKINNMPELSHEEIINRNIDALRQLTAHIKGREIKIAIECLREPSLVLTIEEMMDMVKAAGEENMGICLDTGHLNLCGWDQEYFIKTAGKHLIALHIADNDRSGDQHLMPYGKGNVKWDKVMRALKEVNYDGLFNYEIPGERSCPAEVRRMKIEYIKEISSYLDQI